MSEIIQLAIKNSQSVKSLQQLSSGERFISPVQLDNNRWSLALYQLKKSGEWTLIKQYDKSKAHTGCKLEVVEQKGKNMAQAKGTKFCFVPYKYNPHTAPGKSAMLLLRRTRAMATCIAVQMHW